MAEVILMPRLSDNMTEGVIAEWHKNVGDSVKKGELLADVETDKATMELESYKDGTLLHIGTIKGGKLQVNDLLAIIGNKGEDVADLIKASGSAAVEEEKVVSKKESTPVHTQEKSLDISTMEEVVLMPRLSDTMTEGVIASWIKSVGEPVKKGDVLAEIETDKATMELESYKDGVLLFQGAKAGEKIQVNDLLCIIGKADLNIKPIIAAAKSSTALIPNELGKLAETVTTPVKENSIDSKIIQTEVVNTGRIFISPLAKKLAEEKGIDLKYVKGSGDNGRIIKLDIDNFKGEKVSESMSQSSAITNQPNNHSTNSHTDVPISQMRKIIAKRLSESLFTAPHFYLTMSIDMDEAVNSRKKLNEDDSIKISFNDIVIKATAMALRKHPKVNSSWMGDVIRFNNYINIGVAVAVEEGLLVPVVKDADYLSFSEIGILVKDFAQKAKDKKLQPSDWEGNTFTISNLGMFGIEEFTAIINPPDSCILAVGGISQIPVVKSGVIVPGNVMKLTLSCDHRVVDGVTGSAFLQTLKSYLEQPLRMLA